jgi:hypothetical protein
MIKSLLVLFNLLGLFLCRLFFPVSVNVSQSVPFSANIGGSFIVQVAINKADLKGIAKFTEQLPKGFTATAIDMQGAKTMFDNNTIQYSWDSLPADNILNISFRVDVGANAAAIKDTLVGKFFYIVDNQKLEADCLPSYMNIAGESVVDGGGSHTIDSVKQCQGGVFSIRRFAFPAIAPNTDVKVTIVIHKAAIIGFAKIEDSIPPGFSAAGVDMNGSSFTFTDNIAKFVWQSIPADSIITISYRLMAGSSVSGTHAVSGLFSYIYQSAPLSCSVGTTIFNTSVLPGNNNVAANNITPTDNNNPANNTVATNTATQNAQSSASPPRYLVFTPTGKVVTTKPDTVKGVTASNPVTPPNDSNATIVATDESSLTGNSPNTAQANATQTNTAQAIPAPQTGINYRVQIMALHNPVDVSYFSIHRKINVQVNMELNSGFTKYTVGNYGDYKSVRDAREDIRNRGIAGPWVVSYNSGVRITVQEALMISHQKWYQ